MGLDERHVDPDPIRQLEAWLADARGAAEPWAEAMVLATATPDAIPSARAVILRRLDERGLVFYTDDRSRKAGELERNPHAAAVILWPGLRRQVRVEGRVVRMARAEAEPPFLGQPDDAKLPVWLGPQSSVVSGREELEAAFAQVRERFTGGQVGMPPWWNGYLLAPETVELWEQRDDRIHDRLLYRRTEAGWTLERLAP